MPRAFWLGHKNVSEKNKCLIIYSLFDKGSIQAWQKGIILTAHTPGRATHLNLSILANARRGERTRSASVAVSKREQAISSKTRLFIRETLWGNGNYKCHE